VQFRNVSDSPQDLPTLGLRVLPGETFEATGDDAKGLQGNPSFERADKPSKTSEKE
jgi:hypothetical protein